MVCFFLENNGDLPGCGSTSTIYIIIVLLATITYLVVLFDYGCPHGCVNRMIQDIQQDRDERERERGREGGREGEDVVDKRERLSLDNII